MAGRDATTRRGRWRALALSIRGLMILTAVLGLVLARQANRAQAQRRAVGLVQAAGGGVGYAHESDNPAGFCALSGPVKSGPGWLRNRIGEDSFRTVTVAGFSWEGWDEEQFEPIPDEALRSLLDLPDLNALKINHRTLNDEQLAIIGGLDSLHRLELTECQGFTGQGLAQLGRLRNLRYLELMLDDLTDEHLPFLSRLDGLEELALLYPLCLDGSGLSHLRTLPQFRALSLVADGLTDRGMEEIVRLVRLRELTIDAGPGITDEGLREIANLTDLEQLRLSNLAGVTDRGISQLGRLKRLRDLQLDHIRIDGIALGSLAELEHLESLTLCDSPISDEGLLAAAAIRPLKRLHTNRLATTDDGVAAFKSIRPDVHRNWFSSPTAVNASVPAAAQSQAP